MKAYRKTRWVKRWAARAVFALAIVCALAASGAGAAPLSVAPLSDADFALSFEGATYALGDPAAPFIAAIEASSGERMAVVSAPSCLFSGEDREYACDALAISTYPIGEGGADAIEGVLLFTDALETPRGVRVGMTRAEVEAAYGAVYRMDFDQMIYDMGDPATEPMLLFTLDLNTQTVSSVFFFRNTPG